MLRTLCALGAVLILCACGGGGGTSASSTSSAGGSGGSGGSGASPPPNLDNYATMTIDAGPPILDTGPDAYTEADVAYVSVTLCAPGSTTNCQTIPYVAVDTGSVGLRIFASALNSSLLSAMPLETDSSANPVGECYAYVDGFVFGSVRQADFTIGGEAVSDMPLQVIADSGTFSHPPSSCSAGGGPNLDTIQAFGANGIIGIGVTSTDCGTACVSSGGYAAAIYYDCPSSGCGSIIGRASSATAPFQQLPNPVAAMTRDDNGTILELPAVPTGGEASVTGTLYFGIGTETDNGLGSASIYTTTTSSSAYGAGLLTVIYNGQTLSNSFIDSGSSFYYFVDNTIEQCTAAEYQGFYCPTSPLNLAPSVEGLNGTTGSAAFTLQNAALLLSTNEAVVPGIGADPNLFSGFAPYPDSFDLGMPFFFGRNVFTAIEGYTAAGTPGPYFAF